MKTNKKITRRQFLQIIAVGGAVGLGSKFLNDAINQNVFFSETRILMGTVVNLKILGVSKQLAENAMTECFNRMESLEKILSRFKADSQLSVLNRDGVLKNANEALIYLLEQSRWITDLSKGAFDVTVKPLLDLYQQSQPNLPDKGAVQKALEIVDFNNLIISDTGISFSQTDMSITLDGIAKGYIVDQGVEVLLESGIQTVMVEAGGDLMAVGEKTPGTPWNIGLQAPRSENVNTLTAIKLSNQAVATSGDYMQSFTSDYSHHHIIDPRTGYSSSELASVSVLAPNVMLADALATTLMVMGTNAGIPLIEGLPNCEALLITKSLKMNRTSGFPKEIKE